VFVATLRYSRRSFRRVVWNSGQQVWAELYEQAWRYFAAMLQGELDRRRARPIERHFERSGLDERPSLANFDWRFNP